MNKKIKALLPFITSVFAAILVEQNLTTIVKALQAILNPAYSLTILTTTAFSLPIFTGIMGVANLTRENTIKKLQVAIAVIFSNAVQLLLTNKISNQEQLQISKTVIHTGRNTLDDRQHEHPVLSWSRLITTTTTLAVTVATLLRTIARYKQENVVKRIETTRFVNQNPTPGALTIGEISITAEETPASKNKGRAKSSGRKSKGSAKSSGRKSAAKTVATNRDPSPVRLLLTSFNAADQEASPATSTKSNEQPTPPSSHLAATGAASTTTTDESAATKESFANRPPLGYALRLLQQATNFFTPKGKGKSWSTRQGTPFRNVVAHVDAVASSAPVDPDISMTANVSSAPVDPANASNKRPRPENASDGNPAAVSRHADGSKPNKMKANKKTKDTRRSNSEDVTMEPESTDDEMPQEPPRRSQRISNKTNGVRGR